VVDKVASVDWRVVVVLVVHSPAGSRPASVMSLITSFGTEPQNHIDKVIVCTRIHERERERERYSSFSHRGLPE